MATDRANALRLRSPASNRVVISPPRRLRSTGILPVWQTSFQLLSFGARRRRETLRISERTTNNRWRERATVLSSTTYGLHLFSPDDLGIDRNRCRSFVRPCR